MNFRLGSEVRRRNRYRYGVSSELPRRIQHREDGYESASRDVGVAWRHLARTWCLVTKIPVVGQDPALRVVALRGIELNGERHGSRGRRAGGDGDRWE